MSSVSEPRADAIRPSAILSGEQGGAASPDVLARAAEFPTLTTKPSEGVAASIDRLLDVTVTVSAELGRITLPISSILIPTTITKPSAAFRDRPAGADRHRRLV